MNDQTKGAASLVLATIFLAFWGVFPRFIGIDFGIFYQSFSRSLIVLLILLVFLCFKRSWRKVEKGDYKWLIVMSLAGFLAIITAFVAFNNLNIGIAFLVFYSSSTLGGYFLGRFFFQEKLTKIKIISLLFCLTGLSIVFSVTLGEGNLFYLFLIILSGLGGASWNVFSKKISTKYSLAQILTIDSLIFLILGLFSVLISREQIFLPSFSSQWLTVFLFALTAIGADVFTVNGFRYLSAQSGTLIMLLEPVFGVFYGWLFFKEVLAWSALIGGLMILIGAALPNFFPSDDSRTLSS